MGVGFMEGESPPCVAHLQIERWPQQGSGVCFLETCLACITQLLRAFCFGRLVLHDPNFADR